MSIQQIIKGNDQWPVYIWTDECDEKSKQQLSNVAQLPFINHHVAAMPDVHVGKGFLPRFFSHYSAKALNFSLLSNSLAIS